MNPTSMPEPDDLARILAADILDLTDRDLDLLFAYYRSLRAAVEARRRTSRKAAPVGDPFANLQQGLPLE